jgi:hypothetical protein
MAIVTEERKVTFYKWKCPTCRHVIATPYEKATQNAAAKHLEGHENLEKKARSWAIGVEAKIEGAN